MEAKRNSTPLKTIISEKSHPFFADYHDYSYIESHGATKIVVVEENKRKYVLCNDSNKEVIKYHIDDGLIKQKNEGDNKCDYGIYTEDELLILVELKGCDYQKAVTQILNTTKLLGIKKGAEKVKRLLARVVLSRGGNVPELRSRDKTELDSILKSFSGNIIPKSKLLEETLSKI